MMMLLGYQGIERSQSELMRLIKKTRDSKEWKDKARERESERVAWHASPEEIAEVLNVTTKIHRWVAEKDMASTTLVNRINAALVDRDGSIALGAVALVWAPELATRLPHWVVVAGATILEPSLEIVKGVTVAVEPATEIITGYWILDPTARNRPDGALRYESWKHPLISDAQICPCQSWEGSNGREHTAQRVWVPAGKLEEMLDEGAIRGNGLRYAVVPVPPKKASGEPRITLRTDTSTTVQEKIRLNRTK